VLGLLLTACLASRQVDGQEVVGVVRDAVSGAPVAGAVVMLLGLDRDVMARTLTGTTGRFVLPRERARWFRMIRIGYFPYEIPLGQLGDTTLTVHMRPLGDRLRPIAVRASAVCPTRRDQREALATWTAVTDGLAAMVAATRTANNSGTVTQILFDRLLERGGERVVRQSSYRVTTGNVAPIRAARSAVAFASQGYVERAPNSMVYFGPDAEGLLHPTFAATHCLSIRVDARRHPGEVGVAFAPVRGRDSIPDIAGVLWLTRSPLALRRLEFEYRGVDRTILDTRAGGRLEFETLTNGVPIISYWHIRSPRLAYLPTGSVVRGRPRVQDSVPVVGELHETGGLIAAGTLADGTVWSVPFASLAGRILDSRSGAPVVGATVTLDSTDRAAVSDIDGRFVFPELLPGPYTMRVRDSITVPRFRVDSGGALVADTILQQVVTRTAAATVEARLDRVETTDMRLPWGAPPDGCHGVQEDERRFVAVGQILTTDSLPLGRASLRLSWSERGIRGLQTTIDSDSDANGQFVVCGVPASIPIVARVVAPSGRPYSGTMVVPERLPDDRGGLSRSTLRPGIRLIVSDSSSVRPSTPPQDPSSRGPLTAKRIPDMRR
jgi:hypothetical protein